MILVASPIYTMYLYVSDDPDLLERYGIPDREREEKLRRFAPTLVARSQGRDADRNKWIGHFSDSSEPDPYLINSEKDPLILLSPDRLNDDPLYTKSESERKEAELEWVRMRNRMIEAECPLLPRSQGPHAVRKKLATPAMRAAFALKMKQLGCLRQPIEDDMLSHHMKELLANDSIARVLFGPDSDIDEENTPNEKLENE